MFANGPILLGWLLTAASCYAAGWLLLFRARVELFREEQHFFRFVTGSACVSLLVFALTAAHLAYRNIFVLLGLMTIAIAAFYRRRTPAGLLLPNAVPVFWKLILAAVFLLYGTYYFAHALGPEASPDGATYHLGIVGRYLRQHGFGKITTDMYANLSEGIEMLFLMAYSMGKHSAASLVEFTFLLALPWGMLSYARRIGYPLAGVFGAIAVFVSPVFGISGTIAYNDAAGACILFALFYLLQIWVQTGQRRLIPLIGVLAGFCYGAKYTLFLALPFAGLFLLWHLVRSRQPFLRPLLLYSACALLFVLPWMAKNWITVWNPFSPFANSLFPNPFVTIQFERQYSAFMRHPEGLTFWSRPIEHVARGGISSGILGPLFLLSPLALLALRFRPGRQLLLAAGVFILPAYTNVETRFLMPMAPFLALSLGLVLAAVPGGLLIALAFHALTAWPYIIPSYAASYVWKLPDFDLAESSRFVPQVETLRHRLPDVTIAELIERATPPNARIFSFDNAPEAYTSREIVIMYESAFGNRLGDTLWTGFIPDRQPTQAVNFEFSPREVQTLRVRQTAAPVDQMWTISELRVMNGITEIPREKSWKLSSSVNPWDLRLAFDNNPATHWSTMEPVRSGMFLEVDLGQFHRVSGIAIEAPPQQDLQLQVEVRRNAETWVVVSKTPEFQPHKPGLNLRADAVAQLKADGITHLLIGPKAFGRDDFVSKPTEWGIEFLDEARGCRLYKLL